jgi:hypothetical protein
VATAEERLRILRLIQDGKISAEEGMQLLDSLKEPSRSTAQTPGAANRGARWFRVCVTDTDSGKARVNVRLPINVVSAGMKMGARFSPEVQGMDTDQLMTLINAGVIGKIVDVYDDEDGEHVEVFLE